MVSIILRSTSQTKIVLPCIIRSLSSSPDVPKFESFALTVPSPFVYHVDFNRPAKMNSFNNAMWRELKECFDGLSGNADCRVVVISGQGKHFTAGLDFNDVMKWGQELSEITDVARKAKVMLNKIRAFQASITSLEDCAKPVLSVVHGACVGAGVDLITAADVRYCTKDAWFQVKEVDLGLAADVGTLQRFPKVIGNMSLARELFYTARRFGAEEAQVMGLVSRVLPDRDSALTEALRVAETIASKSPVAVQTTKRSAVYSLSRPTEDGLAHVQLLNQVMLQSEDFVKACVASVSKDESVDFDKL